MPPRNAAERRRAEMRQTIIRAAERMFGEEGEAGLSIRRLADEVNYSPASIYKYFDSKTALIDELKEAFFAGLNDRILETVERFRDQPHDALMRECIVSYVEIALERSHHYAAAFSAVGDSSESGRTPEEWDAFVTTRKGIAFNFLVDSVKRGQALGVFDPELDPPLTAKSIWASCHGLAQLLLHLPGLRIYSSGGVQDEGSKVLHYHAALIVRGLIRPHQSTTHKISEVGPSNESN